MGCPWQHLHGLIQHFKAYFPVILVSVAMEEQAIEYRTEGEVILRPWGRGRRDGVSRGLGSQLLAN